jgi:class 3 adenylate cyclase
MGIEKIKTLGDAYIAVCGMPKEDPNHANRLLEFARGMIKDIEEYNKTATVKFSMRIGINSGEVTAGIIGKTKFIYDIWGDAVNVASRMENCGIANMITVSESTYNLTKDSNSYKEDFLEIKGKGKMRIFRTE